MLLNDGKHNSCMQSVTYTRVTVENLPEDSDVRPACDERIFKINYFVMFIHVVPTRIIHSEDHLSTTKRKKI